jgi:hypothetical protein|tara:strand:- start:266 stop:523 length:258 start_codon:yes stop_codon:yes gene_type:complete
LGDDHQNDAPIGCILIEPLFQGIQFGGAYSKRAFDLEVLILLPYRWDLAARFDLRRLIRGEQYSRVRHRQSGDAEQVVPVIPPSS